MSAVKLPVRFSALNRSAVQSPGVRRERGQSCFRRGGRGKLGQEREQNQEKSGGGEMGGSEGVPGSGAFEFRQGPHSRG